MEPREFLLFIEIASIYQVRLFFRDGHWSIFSVYLQFAQNVCIICIYMPPFATFSLEVVPSPSLLPKMRETDREMSSNLMRDSHQIYFEICMWVSKNQKSSCGLDRFPLLVYISSLIVFDSVRENPLRLQANHPLHISQYRISIAYPCLDRQLLRSNLVFTSN